MIFSNLGKVAREVLSEPGPNGTLSWGRIASSVVLVAAVVWIAHSLIKGVVLSSIPWRDIGEFILMPYGSNKLSTMVQAFSQNPVNK